MKQTAYTLLYLMALLLAVPQTAAAQTKAAQDALYIFRNDGGFDAFFYADIDHIEYSKIDTLDVEQADYVVQEVYALDTIYRIPISAIDSVAFVTPETKYKAGVTKMEESLRSYVTSVDGMTLMLAANTPGNLLPKVGDKLTLLQLDDLFPYGFAGEVVKAEDSNGGYIVTCDTLDLTEAFDRLVIKGGATGYSDNEASAARRKAKEYGTDGLVRFDLPKIDKSVSLTSAFKWTENLSTDVSATAGCVIKPSIYVRAFLYIGWGAQFTSTVRAQMDTELSLGISGAFTAHADIPLAKIPIPLGQPLVRVDTDFGIFSEGQGSLNSTFKVKAVPAMHGYVYYDSNPSGRRQISAKGTVVSFDTEWQKLTGKVSVSAGIYCETGVVALSKRLGKISLRGDVGVRIDMEAEIKAEELAALGNSMTTTSLPWDKKTIVYDLLNRDGSLGITVYKDVAAIAKFASWENTAKDEDVIAKPVEGNGGLVPAFSKINVQLDDQKPNEAVLSADASRLTPFLQKLGFQIFDENNTLVGTEWHKTSYWKQKPNHIDLKFANLEADKTYYAYPATTLFGYTLTASPRLEFKTPKSKIGYWLFGTYQGMHNSYGYRVTFDKDGTYIREVLDRDGNVELETIRDKTTWEIIQEGVPNVDKGTYTITSYDEWVTPDGNWLKGNGVILATGTVHVEYINYLGESKSEDYTFQAMNQKGKLSLDLDWGKSHFWYDTKLK